MPFRHLMLVPSLACPASCEYCFGPHVGNGTMPEEVVNAIVEWQKQYNDEIEITFHGGEPLVVGFDFYSYALPILKKSLSHRRIRFAMQSNLWLLTDELCRIFKKYNLTIGTSLDGPEEINDAQRGKGYFKKTMKGIELAHRYGIEVGCICTFTRQSVSKLRDVFDFFLSQNLNFTIHSSLPSLHYLDDNNWVLPPNIHTKLLTDSLEIYLRNIDKIKIGTLDSMCRSIPKGNGGICTFGDCLGNFLAVGPDGSIYPCQRFVGLPEYSMGNVKNSPADEELRRSKVWGIFQARQEHVKEECRDCSHFNFCKGGCPYNALVAGHGHFESMKDPHCIAYKEFFTYVTDKAVNEIFLKENMLDVIKRVDSKRGLMRKGKLLSIMREGAHPFDTARHARRILASVALASLNSPEEATAKMQSLGLLQENSRSLSAMKSLYDKLNSPAKGFYNLYLYTSFACNLRCNHCYAEAGISNSALPVEEIIKACKVAAKLGFRHAVILGGEPLVYPDKDKLLDELLAIRQEIKPLLTVLRTNLAIEMDKELLRRIGYSTDEVVVSVDGNLETHDARRGKGNYDVTVNNLKALRKAGYNTNLSLATVLPMNQVNGDPGNSVRELARELNIKRIRFKPLLPLGRAISSNLEIVPETLWAYMDPQDIVEQGFNPTSTCGIGQNLYVEPDGKAYPCYAWHGKQWCLGSIIENGLESIVQLASFKELKKHDVNSNKKCSRCNLRYLCGGACRAWNRQPEELQTDLDSPPIDCLTLEKRARSIFLSALKRMGIVEEIWKKIITSP